MSLTRGARLGVYEVVDLLGGGGMGEVWRATDTQLHRDVALKILPDAFASDPDRLARFEREAHVLASLNHPNIAAIHGIEGVSGERCEVGPRRGVGGPTQGLELTERESAAQDFGVGRRRVLESKDKDKGPAGWCQGGLGQRRLPWEAWGTRGACRKEECGER